MEHYWNIFVDAYKNYAEYLWFEISHPHAKNYFYWLIIISLFFFVLEIIKPWRKGQAVIRKDFWLDFFYMFFNFFLFSLIVYNAMSSVVVEFFNEGIQRLTGFDLSASNPLYSFPHWAILLTGFVVRDFVQWNVHRLLHRVPRLWEYHKVHHSVEQMGFAAHLRYHWMENIVYRTLEYIPLALLGIGLYDFFIIHLFTLAVGHFNHSNFSISGPWSGVVFMGLLSVVFVGGYFDVSLLSGSSNTMKVLFTLASLVFGYFVLGPVMKKLFNSPEMHIWHHAKEIPSDRKFGVNFGITLALWDFIFGTSYWPKSGRDTELGFDDIESFPKDFIHQNIHGFKSL